MCREARGVAAGACEAPLAGGPLAAACEAVLAAGSCAVAARAVGGGAREAGVAAASDQSSLDEPL